MEASDGNAGKTEPLAITLTEGGLVMEAGIVSMMEMFAEAEGDAAEPTELVV